MVRPSTPRGPFAASATHELRTPLQGALTNLDIARSGRIDESDRAEVLGLANDQLQRMATALSAVRALADAEFADRSWFDEVDLADVAEAAVADERRRAPLAMIEIDSTPSTTVIAWRDGVRLAIANLVRNALLHGVPADGAAQTVRVSVVGSTVTVEDNGPGIPVADRQRVLATFRARRWARVRSRPGHRATGGHRPRRFCDGSERAPLGGASVVLALN